MSLLIASCASAERTFYCAAGSTSMRMFNATSLLNGSDERQLRGRMKAAGHWFESGRCVGAFRAVVPNLFCTTDHFHVYVHSSKMQLYNR